MNLSEIQTHLVTQMEQALKGLNVSDSRLAEAMHYALMNGGKRFRPYLVYTSCEALGGTREQANAAAIAVEMIHSYSLVHDDLPAMDDDDLRRGKPTCHIAYDEATAILVGDALLTSAFEVIAQATQLSEGQRLKLVSTLSQAAGAAGMVAGQSIDFNHVGKSMSLQELSRMHEHKTGALIRASVQMGAMCAQENLSQATQDQLTRYANALGLAFQVQDDILDVEADTETLGKPQGADLALNKPTYPALLGLEGARQEAQNLVNTANQALEELDADTGKLAELAIYAIKREF